MYRNHVPEHKFKTSAKMTKNEPYMSSVVNESTKLLHAFAKRFPVGSRQAVTEMVAAYGVRALLATVPLARVTMADVTQAADVALRDLDGVFEVKKKRKPLNIKTRPRKDAAQAWPFVDDVGGVRDALTGGPKQALESLPAREQIRRSKSVYMSFRRGRDALPREFVPLALDEVVGRKLAGATHDKFTPDMPSISCLQFLKIVRAFLKTPENELPDGPHDDDLWDLACRDVQEAPPFPTVKKHPPKELPKRPKPKPSFTKPPVPKHLKGVQSKIKPQLDERRAALRRSRQFAQDAVGELIDDPRRQKAEPPAKALAIADAFLNSPLVAQWGPTEVSDDPYDDDDVIPQQQQHSPDDDDDDEGDDNADDADDDDIH